MPPHFLLLVFYGPAGIMTDRIIKSLRRRALKNHLVQTLTHHHLDIRGSWCPNLALLLPVQLCKSVATGSTAPIAMGSMPLIIQGAISVLAWLCVSTGVVVGWTTQGRQGSSLDGESVPVELAALYREA